MGKQLLAAAGAATAARGVTPPVVSDSANRPRCTSGCFVKTAAAGASEACQRVATPGSSTGKGNSVMFEPPDTLRCRPYSDMSDPTADEAWLTSHTPSAPAVVATSCGRHGEVGDFVRAEEELNLDRPVQRESACGEGSLREANWS
mmetsp:Transcript_46461/g.129293  ORF Transcript_46461/g.129293 Transcript_46461/m.129293 type:complete len:146 (-) Transcript_46461:639-1076(-)